MQSYRTRTIPHIRKIIKSPSTLKPPTRNMAFFLPRVALNSTRGRVPIGSHDLAPIFNLFDDTFSELSRATGLAGSSTWNPRFDVREAKDAYIAEGEVPGFEQKDLSIEFVDDHTLTIKGYSERQSESGDRVTEAVESGVEKRAIKSAPADKKSANHHATVEDESTPATAATTTSSDEKAVTTTAAGTEVAKTDSQPKHQFWISERQFGSFERSFSFPARVDQDGVKASLKNGVLSVVIPKARVSVSRRVNIE
jgi:HSP20 family protein